MDVQDRVYALLAPVVATLGVELIDVEFTGGTLRVVVDVDPTAPAAPAPESAPTEAVVSEAAPTEAETETETPAEAPSEKPEIVGVTTGQLAAVNRLVSPILDQHDPIPGRYTLEVSSPGLERPLRRPEHYRRAIGEDVIVKMVPTAEARRVKGRLVAITSEADSLSDDESDILITVDVVEVDGVDLDADEQRQLPLSEVASARTVFLWGPGPKPGQPGSGKGQNRKSKASKKSSQLPSQPRGAQ